MDGVGEHWPHMGRTPGVRRLPAARPGLSLLICVPGFLCEDVTRQRARHASCAPAEHGVPSPRLPSGLEKVRLAGPSLVAAAWVTVSYGPGSRGLRMTHQDTDPLCLGPGPASLVLRRGAACGEVWALQSTSPVRLRVISAPCHRAVLIVDATQQLHEGKQCSQILLF